MKKSILFVDDEPSVLRALERALRGQRAMWDMAFAQSGQEALQCIETQSRQQPFDAIVTDMRMPGMDGAQLLTTLADSHPELIRIVLSGHSDEEMIMRSTGVAHQFLAKPCEADLLKESLSRALDLKSVLRDERLQAFTAGLKSIPSLPATYQEMMARLRAPGASLREIGSIIGKDPGMTVKVLQLVNSAFFGLGRHVSDPAEAATLIGLDVLKGLVLSVGIFSQFNLSQNQDKGFSLDGLMNHSLLVGRVAQRFAQTRGVPKILADDCFLAGLLHDIGILIFELNRSADYAKVRELMNRQGLALEQAEQQLFNATHGEVGAYLLGIWGLSDEVVEAVLFHHRPSQSLCKHFSPLAAVHAADFLINQSLSSDSRYRFERGYPDLDWPFLERIGLSDAIPVWKTLTLEENLGRGA